MDNHYRVPLIVTATVGGASGQVVGHVDYVTDEGEPTAPLPFLLEVLADPANLALLIGGALVVLGAALGYRHWRPLARDIDVFRDAVGDYADLIPWLLRLSFGIPLVGAGFVGYLYSPVVQTELPLVAVSSRVFQIGIGFLLLFGLATRAAAAAALLVYLLSAMT